MLSLKQLRPSLKVKFAERLIFMVQSEGVKFVNKYETASMSVGETFDVLSLTS